MTELFAYTITAHVARHKNQSLRLGHLYGDGNGGHLLDAFDAAMAAGAAWPPEEKRDPNGSTTVAKVMFSQPDPDLPSARFGRIEVDRQAPRHELHRAAEDEVISVTDRDRQGRPLFFYLLCPPESRYALLLTERSGGFGIVRSFWQGYLKGELRRSFEGVTFEIGYFNPRHVWDEYLERGQGVEGLEARRVVKEIDETKAIDDPARETPFANVLTRVDRKLAPARERVASILRNNDAQEAVRLVLPDHEDEIDPSDYDEFALRLEIANKKRLVRLGDPDVPPVGYVVEGMDLDEDDYPEPEAMATFARDLINGIGGPIGLTIDT